MTSAQHYDVAIIGAGMSGLAAGIRIAHFGKKVLILERHNAPGGLNGFYSIEGRKYDVGLHALTNYVPPGTKGTPLGKLLRQLRIDRAELDLCPQKQSRIAFGPRGETKLRFTNDPALLETEIARNFPAQIDNYRRLLVAIRDFDEVSLNSPKHSARDIVRRHITDPLLENMLFCPLMYYGSATEHDMDFAQFAIMFKALYLEGFARPLDGVRTIIRVLLEKYRAAGGQRRMKTAVRKIITRDNRATALLLDNGEEITATRILSTIGAPETQRLLDKPPPQAHPVGKLSYAETITILDKLPPAWSDDTIVFFNDSENFAYEAAVDLIDTRSGVICFPNNFDYGGRALPEGIFRCTCLANHSAWDKLPPDEYRIQKQTAFRQLQQSARRFLPQVADETLTPLATDMFTPLTITRFTSRLNGAIYGSPEKIRTGETPFENLHLAGTDQGFLGIIGALLSGISMANYHVLQRSG